MKKLNSDFISRQKSMLKVDFKRMLLSPLTYIMLGVSFVIPILILVMTSTMGGGAEGAEVAGSFTNIWQAFGSAGSSGMSMDLTSMCNINLLYFLIAVFVCLFVGEEFRCGYCKNLFTVRSKKLDYVISKTAVSFAVSTVMLLIYFIGAMIGGAIAGLSFDLAEVGASPSGIAACMLSKIFFALVFVSISLTLSTVGKSRLWLSILGTFGAGMLLFTMIPLITPLDANALNVIMCLFGGALFAVGLGAASNVILNKTSLI